MADTEGSFSGIGYSRGTTSPLKTVLFYSFMILLLPLFMYYFSKNYIFEGLLDIHSKTSVFYGAIAAVVTVHVVLVIFIYQAYTEPVGVVRTVKAD